MGTASSKIEGKGSKVKGSFGLIGERENDSIMACDDYYVKEKENSGVFSDRNIGLIASVPNAAVAEQIAAGWPRWLAEAASEAINGWIPQSCDNFDKTDKIGTGTYSNVYKAYDRMNNKFVALKKVRFDTSEPSSVKFMAREILILRRLDHQNIIKLEGVALSRMQYSLHLIFEYLACDLTTIISQSGVQFTEAQVKCYMHQLLSGIEHSHSRGVLHRDIKSSNILIDDLGRLKIADFGLSTFYNANTPLTSRIGTLWYRSPELLLGSTLYGPTVDLWSTGCVFGELYIRKPLMSGRTEVERLHKIFKLCGSPSDDYFSKPMFAHRTSFRSPVPYKRCSAEIFNSISTVALGLMETLLSIDSDHRGTATSALMSEFFTSEPLACDPSSLAGFRHRNKSNVELAEDEAARLHILGAKKRYECEKKGTKIVRARRIHQTGSATLKLDHNGFRAKNINSSSQLVGTSSNVAEALRGHDHLREYAPGARVSELEVDESLSPADSGYAGQFGIPLADSYRAKMIQNNDQYMQESGKKNWPENRGGVPVQAIAKNLRPEKRRVRKFWTQERQTNLNTLPSGSSLDSAKKIDDLLEEHDRQIQEAVQRSMVEKKMVKTSGIRSVSYR